MITEKVLLQLEFNKVLDHISNYTSTEIGKDFTKKITPEIELNEVVRKGGLISEAKNILIEADIPPINFIPNLFEVLSRSSIEGAILTVKQILEILNLTQTSRKLYQYLKSYGSNTRLYSEYGAQLFVDKVFEHRISNLFTESGELKDNASTELRDIRRTIIEKSDNLRKSVNKILKRLSESYLVQEEYVTLRDGRIVLPVKAEHKRHVKGFVHSESSTGQTVYIEPEETLELNNEILSLSFAEKREIERILKNVTEQIGQVKRKLADSLTAIAAIDSIFACARYSIEILGSSPTFDQHKPFEVIDAKHPLLLKKLGRENTVPLNLKIVNQKVILITGPNAGGKTVVLKTIGLLSLLAMSGLHIPVSPDSNFWFFDNLLMDIGDQQSIEDDLSTFSSHLKNINDVLNNSNDKSLVLLDEIGTGTDPAEGSALATAVLIKLKKMRALVFATTHHGNLKLIANDLEGFENASMIFDSTNLIPTYIFSQGTPGSSYAFEVAQRIGLKNEIVDIAKQYLDTNKTRVEEFLITLEKQSNELKEKLNFYEIENFRLQGLIQLYSKQVKELEKEKKEILKKTKLDADNYLSEVNKKIESAIKSIRESNASREIIREQKRIIEELKVEHKTRFENKFENYTADDKFEIGDYASIKNTETKGKIIELLDERAVLLAGSVKVKVRIDELLKAKKKDLVEPDYRKNNYSTSVSSTRLDIRGKKPEEAELEILKYIDNAYTNNINMVGILHGKGTGVLKQLVQEILSKHDGVKNFYYAKIEYGGEGITVVELK